MHPDFGKGLLTVLVALLAAPAAAELEESFSFDSRSLYVGNLIGEIRVEGYDGSDFEVEVQGRGSDATRGNLRIETKQGSRASLVVVFPVDRERRYVYPNMEGRHSFELRDYSERGDSWLRDLFGSFTAKRIRVSRSGSGLEMWADVTVRVPKGRRLEIDHGVGEVRASGVEGEVEVDVVAGAVTADDVRGELVIDTGSGNVELREISGELSVDTGSGAVRLADYDGPQLEIDTGSGSVEATRIRSRRLVIDTGSGRVQARQVSCDGAIIDTGSGAVTLALDEMGEGRYEIDTGSGSITLLMPHEASADVEADTGSGGIDVDLPDVRTVHRERNNMRFRVGRGDARVTLDTGSGSIRIASRD